MVFLRSIRLVCLSLVFSAFLWLPAPCFSQEKDNSFQAIRKAADARAAATKDLSSEVEDAVQALQDSPGFEEFAAARLNHLSTIWDWQSAKAQSDKNKEAFRQRVMKEAEEIVDQQIGQNPQLGRLRRLKKKWGGIHSDFADAEKRMNQMQEIPNELYDLDRQIATLQSASDKTDSAIQNAKARNAKVKDPAIKNRNARLIAKAEKNVAITKVKIKELKTIRSNLERDLRQFSGGKNLAESQKLLKRRQVELDAVLKVSDRQLQDVGTTLDALLHTHNLPVLKEARGAVQVTRNGTTFAAGVVTSLLPGDVIKTGKSSSMVLKLEDGTYVRLGSSSAYTISKKWTRESTLEAGVLFFQSKLKYIVGRSKWWLKKASRSRWERIYTNPRTDVVTSSRGTEFLMQVDREGMRYFLRRGELEVTLKNGETKRLTGGSYYTIDKDGKGGEVKALTDEEFYEAVDKMSD